MSSSPRFCPPPKVLHSSTCLYFHDPCSSGSNILKFERREMRDEGDILERESLGFRAKWEREREASVGEEGEERKR